MEKEKNNFKKFWNILTNRDVLEKLKQPWRSLWIIFIIIKSLLLLFCILFDIALIFSGGIAFFPFALAFTAFILYIDHIIIKVSREIKANIARDREETKMYQKMNSVQAEYNDMLKKYRDITSNLKTEKTKLEKEIEEKKQELDKINEIYFEKEIKDLDNVIQEITLKKYSTSEIKIELNNVQLELKKLIKQNRATDSFLVIDERENKNNIKKILRCLDSESTLILQQLTVKNFNNSVNKLNRSLQQLNKLFESNDVAISSKCLKLKQKELVLAYEFLKTKEEEEIQKQLAREQLLEEQKVLRELENKEKELKKEEKSFTQEIDRVHKYLLKATMDAEKQLYIDKIKSLEDQLKQIKEDIKDVENRQTNTRAGYVYIISNIGSFGENVYKIGVTRRLEPMDRIKELSSASVPFEFDVHAFIFSDDAPKLENILHNHFTKNRINKVNLRKEFFKVSLDEIKKVVSENFDKTVIYEDLPQAEEYFETLEIIKKEK